LDGLELVHEAARQIRQADDGNPVVASSLTADELKLPLGDYKIVREIGRGGMGIVYEATQLSLGRRVALKILPLAAALDPKHLQRFKNEAQAAAQLHHTNIVPVYAVGTERGVHYYAMQLIEGQSLAALIEQLRQREPGAPCPAADTVVAQLSTQRTGGAEGYRTAVYALGATFYELLTLSPLFPGTTRQELLHQVLHDEPRPLRAVERTVPVELETIILKAVSKAPAERYGSARELADDLERFLQ